MVRVVAIDRDKNPGPVKFFMIHDTPESLAFEITEENRVSGRITLKNPVDRETNHWINVTVMAKDDGTPSLNSTAKVNVQIEDVNDNSPEWVVFNNTVYVWENATIWTVITEVLAIDADSGAFGEVMYFIISGSQDRFSVGNVSVSILGS